MSINRISTGYYQTGYTNNQTAKATGTSFANQLNNIAGKGHIIYMKTDDMLYSEGQLQRGL